MEHSFNIEIASRFGIKEAILINHFLFWVNKNVANEKHFYEGRYWTYSSIRALHELFPYMSEKTIRGAIQNLLEEEIIITGNFNKSSYDRTLWYAFTDKALCILQNMKIHLPIWENENDQKGKPIPDIKHIKENINIYKSFEEKNTKGINEEIKDDNISEKELLEIDEYNFNIIWKEYPRKDGKTEAFKRYRKWVGEGRKVNGKLIKLEDQQILNAVCVYKKEVEYTDMKYIKQGSTFFGDCLLDYIKEV